MKTGEARLIVLDVKRSSILSFDTEGNDLRTIIDNVKGILYAITVDPFREHIYWTNMGEYREGEHFPENDGSIERVNFDGSDHTVIIPKGVTFTPTQMQIDIVNGFMYWSDREGMRVMRAKLDGSEITTLIQTGENRKDRKDEKRHCTGVAIDCVNGHLYWTQKGPVNTGAGRIFRAGITVPPNSGPRNRNDVELLFDKLREPVELEIDHMNGNLYWTGRGDKLCGNTLNRASISNNMIGEPELLALDLKEGVRLSVDAENCIIYFSDLTGHIYSTNLQGSHRYNLYSDDRSFTGIAYVPGGLNLY